MNESALLNVFFGRVIMLNVTIKTKFNLVSVVKSVSHLTRVFEASVKLNV